MASQNPHQMSAEDAVLYDAAEHLRNVANDYDLGQSERSKSLPRNDRESRVSRSARAYGLRWAADIIDPTEEA